MGHEPYQDNSTFRPPASGERSDREAHPGAGAGHQPPRSAGVPSRLVGSLAARAVRCSSRSGPPHQRPQYQRERDRPAPLIMGRSAVGRTAPTTRQRSRLQRCPHPACRSRPAPEPAGRRPGTVQQLPPLGRASALRNQRSQPSRERSWGGRRLHAQPSPATMPSPTSADLS